MRPTEAGMPGLADRLNELFRTVRRPGTTDLWNNETAAWEISRSGPPVSAAYLSQLRTGKRLNPSARHLAALATIFRVEMESFFPPWSGTGPAAGGGRSPAESRVLMLLDGVSPAGLAAIENAVAAVRAAEELPPITPAQLPDAGPGPAAGNATGGTGTGSTGGTGGTGGTGKIACE